MLQHVSEQEKTPEVCLEAVKQTGEALEYVPETLKTPELCLAAVRQTGEALKFVPEELKTVALCTEAVSKRPNFAIHFPDGMLLRAMAALAKEESNQKP